MAEQRCTATLERHGAPHTCLVPAGEEHQQHVCRSCGTVWSNRA